MYTRTIRFPKRTRKAYTSVVCAKCGKRRKRQKKFTFTVNPFNKNSKGEVKTAAEVDEDLKIAAKDWVDSVKLCSTCEKQERGW